MNEYDITEAFRKIENELIASMIRNMDRHRAEEDKEGKEWSMWQAEQLKALEKYKVENQKKYPKQFKKINQSVAALISEARERGSMEQEIEILEAVQNGFKGMRKISRGMTGEFFKLNERKLEALIKATVSDMEKAEVAILRMANDQYRKVIFSAQVYANSGAGTYEKAVDMATRDMLAAGLNCVEYANGARHTLSNYARMALRTASKRAYLQGEGEKRQEWGISTVIVNKRGNPCPKCLPFVGKVLIDDVWSGGKPEDGPYPLMSTAVKYGLYHPNCKDGHTTYFKGISTADDTWTKEELEEIGYKYQIEQKQLYAERQVEKYDRLSGHSLDDENQKRYAARREEWKRKRAEMTSVTEETNLAERRKQRLAARGKRPETENISPDFSHMDSSQLLKYASENLKTVFIDTRGANTDYIREAVKVLDQFEKRLNGNTINGLKVKFGGTPQGVYAKYDDSMKTLLLKKTGSIRAFEESLQKENARYRIKWRTELDYHATESFSGTIWHELGHAVDVEYGQAFSRKLSSNAHLEEASLRVSAYARTTQGVRVTKRSEAWAENFSAYMDGGKNRGKVPEEIATMIEDYFKKSVTKTSESGIMKMNLQTFAYIPNEKLVDYALNPAHPIGKEKAKAFKRALGYTQENSDELKAEVLALFREEQLVLKREDQYGKRYEQIMEITGPNGKTANVLTAWVKETESSEPRLTSLYVTDKEVK